MSMGSHLRLSQKTAPTEKEILMNKEAIPAEIAQILKFKARDDNLNQRRLQSAQLKIGRAQQATLLENKSSHDMFKATNF